MFSGEEEEEKLTGRLLSLRISILFLFFFKHFSLADVLLFFGIFFLCLFVIFLVLSISVLFLFSEGEERKKEEEEEEVEGGEKEGGD